MPRTEQQNEALRAESRAHILQHALRLFAEHGYEQTSVRMIAQSAGVAQGLLYNYFAGKEALLRAIFEQSIADVRESFAQADQAEHPRQALEALMRSSFAILQQNLHFWRISYGIRLQPGVLKGLGDDIQVWAGEIREKLEHYFRAAGYAQPEIEAAILFALIDGISQHYVLDPEHYPLNAIVEALIARY